MWVSGGRGFRKFVLHVHANTSDQYVLAHNSLELVPGCHRFISPSTTLASPLPTTQKDDYEGEDGYMASHSLRDLLADESAQRLLCLVQLPELDVTMLELEELMKAQPVGQGPTRLIEIPWGRWECSQWAIRTIKSLVDEGILFPQSSKSFFTKKAAERAFWGPMLQVAGMKCAHEIQARKAHNCTGVDASSVVDIEIMSLDDSGILL